MGWPWKVHARHLAEAEWIAFRRSRVRSTAQFLLYDDAPLRDYPPNDPRHWGTFQTGLRTNEGKKKTAYAGYQRPIHLVRGRRKVTVFGLYRPADDAIAARVQFRRRGSSRWRNVKTTKTNGHGFLRTTIASRRRGWFRIAFEAGSTVYTRSVSR